MRWLVEEIIDDGVVTYWLHDDRLEAEHQSLLLASERRGGRMLTIADVPRGQACAS